VPSRDGLVGELIAPAVAAARLSVTAKVLQRWRATGVGPAFVMLTSKTIRYRPEDLDAFIADRMRAGTSTP
jgi:predicted site-specific integrase-resolvase